MSVGDRRVAQSCLRCPCWAPNQIAEASEGRFPQQTLSLSNSHNLLGMDPGAFALSLQTARPMPVSAEDKARVLSLLPEEGEVTKLNAAARQKLAALNDMLRRIGRDSVYDIKVVAVPQAGFGLHARAVLLISEAALTLVDADELQALLAHEIGHEYVWAARERAFQLADRNGLKDLDLVCDAIAIVTLYELGMDVSRLMTVSRILAVSTGNGWGPHETRGTIQLSGNGGRSPGRLPRGHPLEHESQRRVVQAGGPGCSADPGGFKAVL